MKIKIDSTQFQLRKRSPLPSEIELNSEVSWMIGVWAGDNWSSKEGTVIRGGQKSSGRFGINNNDEEVIQRFLQGLKSQFKITKIKIDVQIPRNLIIDKENIKLEVSKKFGIEPENINVYRGSPWRRKIGFAVYTNNTALLRFVNKEIYKKLPEFIQNNSIDVGAFLQGIADSEGDVDKANKNIGFTSKDTYVASLIVMCLEKLGISFKKRIDERQRIIIEVTSLNEFNQKVGFWIKRKQQALQEILTDCKAVTDILNNQKKNRKTRELLEIYIEDILIEAKRLRGESGEIDPGYDPTEYLIPDIPEYEPPSILEDAGDFYDV